MPGTSSVTSAVGEVPVRLAADDGVPLAGTWFEPAATAAAPSTAIVVACGAGIPARFYRRLAQYLAARGAAVLTFDYRGVGASRAGSLRRMRGGMDDWALHDIAAALAEANDRYPALPLATVAHSVGALLVGAADRRRFRHRHAELGEQRLAGLFVERAAVLFSCFSNKVHFFAMTSGMSPVCTRPSRNCPERRT
jgi:predicted alpha/beta hydrolase